MMTRSSLVLAALVLAAAPMRAQSVAGVASHTRFGVIGGVNFATITETKSTDPLTGVYAGLQLVLPRNEIVSLQLEAAWSQRGVHAPGSDSASGAPLDVTLHNDYVEMPILIRLESPLALGIHPIGVIPFLVVGPSFGVSVHCTIARAPADGSTSASPDSQVCDTALGVKTFDFGAVAGAGFAAPVGSRAFTVSARYTLGLEDVFEGRTGRSRTLALLAGLTF